MGPYVRKQAEPMARRGGTVHLLATVALAGQGLLLALPGLYWFVDAILHTDRPCDNVHVYDMCFSTFELPAGALLLAVGMLSVVLGLMQRSSSRRVRGASIACALALESAMCLPFAWGVVNVLGGSAHSGGWLLFGLIPASVLLIQFIAALTPYRAH